MLWRLDLIKCWIAVVEGVRVEEACASGFRPTGIYPPTYMSSRCGSETCPEVTCCYSWGQLINVKC